MSDEAQKKRIDWARWMPTILQIGSFAIIVTVAVVTLKADVSSAHDRLDKGETVDQKQTDLIQRLDRLIERVDERSQANHDDLVEHRRSHP